MPETTKLIGEVVVVQDTIDELRREGANLFDFRDKIEKSIGRRTTELIELIMAGSFLLEGSDVHFEPKTEYVKFRLRIDGVLHDIFNFDWKTYKILLSRIKLLSALKLNVTSRPQDGRFSLFIERVSIEIRTSVLPSEYGESIVMRILNPKWVVNMEQLGLRDDMLEIFKQEALRPNGMIVCTGPTGAGKTTTLYAFLGKINNPEIKIITIEDPIEYHLKGVSQTQVDKSKGYDFANGLRAIVRQDPDVILVGEIRDFETAQISLQASLTGHLVLSTVHTNNAAGTVARMVALGETVTNIAPSLNMIIAQRLVRKACRKCVEFLAPKPEVFEKLKKNLKNIPKNVKMPELKPGIKIPRAKGCKECSFTGYKGRIGIFESVVIDDDMEKFILSSPSVAEMREKAISKGMTLMYQDGLIKILNGITTLDEVERVAEEKD